MYKIANSKDAENEAAKDILTSLGSSIHYDIDNYDYLASYQIYDPYIIQNIKTLEGEGLKGVVDSVEIDIEKIRDDIGYVMGSKKYSTFIKGKSEQEIVEYRKCYAKLLFGEGHISLLDINPIILNNCIEEIEKNLVIIMRLIKIMMVLV